MGNPIEKLKKSFYNQFPDKEIVQILDYKEKGIYVVLSVPSKLINKKSEWKEDYNSFDRKTFKYLGDFTPMIEDPNKYFEMPGISVIYRRL